MVTITRWVFQNYILKFLTYYILKLTKFQLLFVSICCFYFRTAAFDSKRTLSEAKIENIINGLFFFSKDEESDANFDYAECSDHDTQSDASLDSHRYDTDVDYQQYESTVPLKLKYNTHLFLKKKSKF